jgi:N-acetylmuramoyl-L-alanine amidase
MKRFFIFAAVVLLAGCAATNNSYKMSGAAGFMPIDDFCRRHNLEYSFDTIDDIVRIYSGDIETRLLLNSQVGYFNGNIFYLQRQPFYVQGNIMLPADLEDFIFLRQQAMVSAPFNAQTIVLDAGHGGQDPGATSPWGVREKDITLRVVKYLEAELKKRGYKVVLTRGYDKFLTLDERVDVARRYHGDLFISIHCNATHSRAMNGTEIYFLTSGRVDSTDRSVKLARTTGLWPSQHNYTTKAILWDLLLTKNYSLSVEAAHIFYHTFRDLGFKVKPPKEANYHVLRNAYVPAVLVETGYLTNREEERLLRKPQYERQIAEAVASSVVFLNQRHNTELTKGK